MNDYGECKFYLNGRCFHEDCPQGTCECIGKEACESWHDDISHVMEVPK